MSTAWYVQNHGSDVIGPVTTELLVEGIKKGRVPISSKVCPVGGTSWHPLAEQPEFADAIRHFAPPPPPSSATPAPPLPTAARTTMRWIAAALAGAGLLVVLLVVLAIGLGGAARPSTITPTPVGKPSSDAGCVPRATALVCAGTTCGNKDDGCGGAVNCGPCGGSPNAPSPSATTASTPASVRSRALDVCFKLQTAGVVMDCRPNGSQARNLNKGLVDAAAFQFTAEVYGQTGTPGFVLQFGDAVSYEQTRKTLHCNEGAPCLGSSSALLIVKTVYGVPIPDRDWNKIQGVLNEAAALATP